MICICISHKVYAVTGYSTVCDRYTYCGTIVNNKWETTETYNHSGKLSSCFHPELSGKYYYEINGETVSEDEFKAYYDKLKDYDDGSSDFYVSFSNVGTVNAVNEINEVLGIKVEKDTSNIDKIKNVYIKKLQDVQESKKSLEDPWYYIYDINKDSIPELIIKRGTCEADYQYDVFSFFDDDVEYVGKLLGGHISLWGVEESGILLHFAHMGYETIFEGSMTEREISYKEIYSED